MPSDIPTPQFQADRGFKVDIECQCGETHHVWLFPGASHRLSCGTVLHSLPEASDPLDQALEPL